MQSFRTLYRFAVMAATATIVVMGWRLYGPPAAEVRSIALRGIEWMEGALRPPNQPSTAPPTSPASVPSLATSAPAGPPPLLAGAPPLAANNKDGDAARSKAGTALTQNVAPASSEDRVKTLLDRLEKLDVQDQELGPWGASGELYRFCCRATWGSSQQFGRHFEAVASDPAAAVEQVLAKVDAWRTAERGER